MARPSKRELLARLFPELRQSASNGEKEAAVRLNTLACEAILADWIRLFDRGLAREGPGVLCLRLHRQAHESSYLARADLEADCQQARRDGSQELETFLTDSLAQLERLNLQQVALVLLLDNSGAQLFVLDRDQPARAIEAALTEFAA